jgi:hypothetical protein
MYLVYPVVYCFEVCIGASSYIFYMLVSKKDVWQMCQDMASSLHVLTVWVARFPPVSAAMILRPAGLYYTVLIQWPELSACCTDPYNHACLVPFTKLQLTP